MEKTSKAIEDYLEALLMLQEKGQSLSVSSVAEILKISVPASSQMASELKDLGYVEKKPYGDISFTAIGREIGEGVYHKHKVLCRYLVSIGVSPETAEADCCRIEHVISEETFRAIENQLDKK